MAPADARGIFLGVLRFNSQLGTVLSPVLFAVLAESAGYDWAFASVAAASLAVAGLLICFIPETITKAA
jgi:MFS family permease